ncbi:MAG: ankyrin repeat domain-containing protein [Rhizobiales bacterium]|nr:ankyrin repeat domain-containing protein [Hyphomicrobiales bacterium]
MALRLSRRALLLGAALFLARLPMAHADDDLVAAATRGDVATIRRLIAAGAPVDARDASGRTALLAATHADQVEAARVLIEAGADVNAKDDIEDSPFLYAAAEGRVEILKLTLAHGADLASTNRYGGVALIPACHHGYPEAVRILLATAIDVDHVNKLGWTALLETVILSDGGPTHVDILKQLVAAGADLDLADRDGVTPLAHARKQGYAEMVAILEKAGAR